MPTGLKRYHESGDLHFITFSCFRRTALLATPAARRVFEQVLEQVRGWYGMCVYGYVVMPEHVHLLESEPERKTLAIAIQMLKQNVAHRLKRGQAGPLWHARGYDFNVWTRRKRLEKLDYMHSNPVTRGLVTHPADWPWSSFRHYATGESGVVEIESEWTARRRERMGIVPQLKIRE